jgi:hypothetical protein
MSVRFAVSLAGAEVVEVPRLPATLEGASSIGPYSVARPGAVLRVVPGLARFLARDGSVIELAKEPASDEGDIESLIQGPLAAALIHQRRELPLHGATLAPPDADTALALVGAQGAGKSTLAYELVRRGWRLLSDDLTRVTRTANGMFAWPGRTGIKLCRDACERFALDSSRMTRVSGERDKFLAPTATLDSPLQLRWIIAIEREPLEREPLEHGSDDIAFEAPLAGRMSLLSKNTFRASYIEALGQMRAHLRMVSAIATATRVVRLRGSGSPAQLAERVVCIAAQRTCA